jgi:hypothetical protein
MPGQPAPGSNPFITFDCNQIIVRELGPLALPETTVIEETRSWQVSVRFQFAGIFAPWLVNLNLPVRVTLRAESMGPGAEQVLGDITISTQAGQLVYGPGLPGTDPTITVPAGTLLQGVYKLVAVVTFPGTPPPPMAGFMEGPIIQVIRTT